LYTHEEHIITVERETKCPRCQMPADSCSKTERTMNASRSALCGLAALPDATDERVPSTHRRRPAPPGSTSRSAPFATFGCRARKVGAGPISSVIHRHDERPAWRAASLSKLSGVHVQVLMSFALPRKIAWAGSLYYRGTRLTPVTPMFMTVDRF